jgi:Uma2 family endonuclease
MSHQVERHYTIEDYFAIEESSTTKHEYFGGEIFPMAGASVRHNRIAGNVYAALRSSLRSSDCEAFGSDLRVRTPGGLYTYPDVLVVCGEIQLSGERLATVTNPTLIVEVLSASTKDYDRGQKFEIYKTIASLREYLLIEQDVSLVERHFRANNAATDAWQRRHYDTPAAQIELDAFGITLLLAEIYERVGL